MIWCFNFKKQFADAVRGGSKTQTVRATRKDGREPKAGDTAKLYTGLRSRHTMLLCPPTQITLVEHIIILPSTREIVIDGQVLDQTESCEFAMRDGFADGQYPTLALIEFLTTPGRMWSGFVVYWRAP